MAESNRGHTPLPLVYAETMYARTSRRNRFDSETCKNENAPIRAEESSDTSNPYANYLNLQHDGGGGGDLKLYGRTQENAYTLRNPLRNVPPACHVRFSVINPPTQTKQAHYNTEAIYCLRTRKCTLIRKVVISRGAVSDRGEAIPIHKEERAPPTPISVCVWWCVCGGGRRGVGAIWIPAPNETADTGSGRHQNAIRRESLNSGVKNQSGDFARPLTRSLDGDEDCTPVPDIVRLR